MSVCLRIVNTVAQKWCGWHFVSGPCSQPRLSAPACPSGVPQGSSPGPLLISLCVNTSARLIDDTVLCSSSLSQQDFLHLTSLWFPSHVFAPGALCVLLPVGLAHSHSHSEVYACKKECSLHCRDDGQTHRIPASAVCCCFLCGNTKIMHMHTERAVSLTLITAATKLKSITIKEGGLAAPGGM